MDHLVTELAIGVLGIILFQYKNEQRDFIVLVSGSVLLLFLSRFLIVVTSWGWSVWIIGAVALLITYYLRFRRKSSRTFIDWIKWIGVALLVIYPATIFDLPQEYQLLDYLLSLLTIPLLATIYLYDRWILKPEKMKKRFTIVLSIQTFLILLMLTYSIIQKAEADKQRRNAEMEKIKSEKLIQELRLVKENGR